MSAELEAQTAYSSIHIWRLPTGWKAEAAENQVGLGLELFRFCNSDRQFLIVPRECVFGFAILYSSDFPRGILSVCH